MHTFRKLPKHSPRAKIAALRKGSTSAKYSVCLDLDDYKPLRRGILSTKVSVLLGRSCGLQVIVRKEEKSGYANRRISGCRDKKVKNTVPVAAPSLPARHPNHVTPHRLTAEAPTFAVLSRGPYQSMSPSMAI